MCSRSFLRRVVPFFATFLMGVFIASFFVTIGRPSFRGQRYRHFEQDRQIRMELERLTEENMRLREQIGEHPLVTGPSLVDPGIRGLVPPPAPRAPGAPHSFR